MSPTVLREKGHNLLQLNEITTLIEEHHHELVDAWKDHFGC